MLNQPRMNADDSTDKSGRGRTPTNADNCNGNGRVGRGLTRTNADNCNRKPVADDADERGSIHVADKLCRGGSTMSGDEKRRRTNGGLAGTMATPDRTDPPDGRG